jgi:hypothetical protein
MKVWETQLVTLNDLDFKDASGPPRERLEKLRPDSELEELYETSYLWLMYKSEKESTSAPDAKLFAFSPPGTERYTFGPGLGKNECRGSILIHPQYGAGVLTQWSNPADHSVDPGELKRESGDWRAPFYAVLQRLELAEYTNELEREYPFVAITIDPDPDDPDAGDVEQYTNAHAKEIGRLFTGGREHEESARLEQYASENISWRGYERLYMRWTDALGVYSKSIDRIDPDRIDSDTRIKTIARAVQLFEICVLVRRILRNASQDISTLSASLTFLNAYPFSSNSRLANQLLAQFTTTELQYLVSPPVRSVEAEWLIHQAAEKFGIVRLIDATRTNYEQLDRRLQWIKAQWLAATAVMTFVANLLVSLFY